MSDLPKEMDAQVNDEHSPPINDITSELGEIQSEQWSRVSPLAILYFFAKTLYDLVNGLFIYSLPALIAGYSSIKENPVYLILGLIALLLIILISSITKYWFYLYKFTDDRVEIKQGVFKKSHLDLPFKKIQNVKIVQPIYYRPMTYSFIELDTAGSAGQEAKIVALPLTLAESFKQMILRIKQKEPSQDQSNSVQSNDGNYDTEVLLNERSLSDLVIHGISNNRVWIFLGFLAPFYNAISENIGEILSAVGFDIAAYLDYQSQSLGLFLLHVLSVVMIIMLVIVTFSVIGSIFIFHNYKLSRLGDRYIRRSGLLTKHEVSMRLSRIQIAVQQQDWLDVLIKRVNLRFEQNTSAPANANQASNINNASKLIVPSVTPKESIDLIQDAFDVQAFDKVIFSPISKRFILRVMMLRFMPIIGLLYTIAFVSNSATLVGHSILGAATVVIFLLVCLRWRRWGYYFSEKYVYIRKGLFGVNYYVFPIAKLQQVKFKQSIFMQKTGLADLEYVLASGAYTVPLLPENVARQQADLGLLTIARDKPAWM